MVACVPDTEAAGPTYNLPSVAIALEFPGVGGEHWKVSALGCPDVSIIVPVYNAHHFLNECLESLVGQTLENIEVLCIDDGSTDGSSQLLDCWATRDARVRVTHKANEGVSAARNLGLEQATGEYVLFVDADDLLADHACEELRNLAEKEVADIVVFGGKTFPTLGWADASFACVNAVVRDGVDALLHYQGSYPLMCNKLYRRSLLEEHRLRLDEHLRLAEDHAFQFFVFPYARVVAFTKDQLYFYRIHKEAGLGEYVPNENKAAWQHLEAARAVLSAWQERGLIKQYEEELLYWLIAFLYNMASRMTFNEREEFSGELAELLGVYLPGYGMGLYRLGREATRRLEFLLDAHDIIDEPPLMTFVLYVADGEPADEKTLGSLEYQEQQNLRIWVECEKDPDESVFALAKRDRRVRILDRPFVEMASELDSSNVWLVENGLLIEPTALREMKGSLRPDLETAEEAAPLEDVVCPDLMVFTDSANYCGVFDSYEYAEPVLSEPSLPSGWYRPSDFGAGFLEAVSMSPSNKVFSRRLVQESSRLLVSQKLRAASSPVVLSTACSLLVPSFLYTRVPFFAFQEVTAACADRLPWSGIKEDTLLLVEALDMAPTEAAVDRAMCSLALTYLMLSVGFERFGRLCELSQAFEEGGAQPRELPEEAFHRVLSSLAARRLFEDAMVCARAAETERDLARALCLSLMTLSEENRRTALVQAEQTANAQEALDRYYSSVTYRIGSTVVDVPRRLVRAVTRLVKE